METYGVENTSMEVLEVLSLLRPFDVSVPKVRVGPSRDGGYVMAERSAACDLMSFGISNDVRFEKALAEKGYRCFLYDHTISSLPDQHELFNFYKMGISGVDDEASSLLSLNTHISRVNPSPNMILKIDVEGAEWDVFSAISINDLCRFEQIVGEFHWFLRLDDEQFRARAYRALKNITSHFTLFNVHANNCRPLGLVSGLTVADVLELAFIRNDLVTRKPSTVIYPEARDRANNEIVTDHALLFYPFMPTSVDTRKVTEVVNRLIQDQVKV